LTPYKMWCLRKIGELLAKKNAFSFLLGVFSLLHRFSLPMNVERLSVNILFLDLSLLNKFLRERGPSFGLVEPLVLSPPEALENAYAGLEKAINKNVVAYGPLLQFLRWRNTMRADVLVWFWAELGDNFYGDRLPGVIPLARQFFELTLAYYAPFIAGDPPVVYEALRQGVRKVYEAQESGVGEARFGEPYKYEMAPPNGVLQLLAAKLRAVGSPGNFSLDLTSGGVGPLTRAVRYFGDLLDVQVAWWSYGSLGVSEDEALDALSYSVRLARFAVVEWMAERVPGTLVEALAVAAREKENGPRMLEILLDAGAEESALGGYAIGLAAKFGNVRNLQILVEACLLEDANQPPQAQMLPKRQRDLLALEMPLADEGRVTLQEQSLDVEFCFDPRDVSDDRAVQDEFAPGYPENMTLLAVAAYYGHVDCVELLVGKGANVRARNNLALRVAFDTGQWDAFSYLLVYSGAYTDREIAVIREPLLRQLQTEREGMKR